MFALSINHIFTVKKYTNKTHRQRGYTIIELLAVMTIVVVVSGMIAGILYSTLRGGSKSKITSDVAQNGNYAISVISQTIILSQDVTSVGGTPITSCITSPTGTSIDLTQSDGSTITFSCTNNTVASTSATVTSSLIDTSNLEVDPTTCAFKCRQDNNNPIAIPVIDVAFSVKQKGSVTNAEAKSSASFSTSTSMRNYNP